MIEIELTADEKDIALKNAKSKKILAYEITKMQIDVIQMALFRLDFLCINKDLTDKDLEKLIKKWYDSDYMFSSKAMYDNIVRYNPDFEDSPLFIHLRSRLQSMIQKETK